MEIPRHNILDSHFCVKCSTIVVMCNGMRFVVEVRAKDLQNTIFASQYSRLAECLENIDDNDEEEYEEMCDWMVQPCFQTFADAARQTPAQDTTLHDFYFPHTLRLRLLVHNQGLVAREIAGRLPKIAKTLTIRSSKLPSFRGVHRLRASSIWIVRETDCNDHLCEIPTRVRTADGTECFFKPALDTSQYIREVNTLAQVSRASLSHLKMSKLTGIVVSDDTKLTLGLLVEWIPSLWNLGNTDARMHQEYHEQWKEQVTATVRELHQENIVWGDVHPGNIVIDRNLEAWIIDFGGGWVEPFVTPKQSGTVEGDLLGISRVFEHLKCEVGD